MKPVKTTIHVPSSKSLTQRALLAAFLADGKSRVINPLIADDTAMMRRALAQQLRGKIDIGNAGTAMRFLLPFLPVGSTIDGNAYMRKRPVKDLLDAMELLGIQTRSRNGYPPVTITARKITAREVSIDASRSSQYLSALLLLAPTLPHGLIIHTRGTVVSKPYIAMTIDVMNTFGIHVERRGFRTFRIRPQTYQPTRLTIEGDYSAASAWFTYNWLSGGVMIMPNLNAHSLQGDRIFPRVLQQLPHHDVVDCNDMPDCVMNLVVAAIFKTGKTTITNIANLRIKETDRLAALHENLRRCGVRSDITTSSITIWGRGCLPRRARIRTHDDHRIAMAFGLLGCAVDRPLCVTKSYPAFWEEMKKIHDANVVLTGMRGSGKTTIGKAFAKRWRMHFCDVDQEIEKVTRMSVTTLVEQKGWDYFRDIEHEVVRRIATRKNCVIATGGGTLMFARNRQHLKTSYTILLTAPIAILAARIARQRRRPSLTGTDPVRELGTVWKKRKASYHFVADRIVDSSSLNFHSL